MPCSSAYYVVPLQTSQAYIKHTYTYYIHILQTSAGADPGGGGGGGALGAEAPPPPPPPPPPPSYVGFT